MKAVLLFLILFCVYDLKCQTNFRPGYVITNENDTLHGLIDYRGDSRNSKKCDFKKNGGSEVKEFVPFGIKGYRFDNGKFYVSKTITSDKKEMQLFLEFLVDGISDLYYFSEGASPHYFIERFDGQLFELTNEQRQFNVDGVDYKNASNKYIGLLKYAFADCQQIFPLINNAKLENKSLIEITKKYHDFKCDGEKCIIYEKQLPGIRILFAPFVSMNTSILKFDPQINNKDFHINSGASPSVGLLLNTSLPNANDKLSFQASGEFSKNYFYGSSTSSDGAFFDEVHLHTSLIKVKGGLKYTYPKGKIRPSLLIGGNIFKPIKPSGRRIQETITGSSIYSYEWNDVSVSNLLTGYNVDLGFDFHFLTSTVSFFNIGYSSSGGGNDFVNGFYFSKLNTLYINAGIYF